MAKEIVIPSNPEDQKKIMEAMQQIHDSLTRIEGERSYIGETIKDLSEKYKIPGKFLRKMARAYHKDNMQDQTQEFEDFQELYDTIVK